MKRGVFRPLYRAVFMLVIACTCAPSIVGAQVDRGNKPFLTASINNSLPYVGQEILLTYTLYFKDAAPKISNETAPLLRGLWAKETAPERYIKSTQTSVHGEPFRNAVVKQFRLMPLQCGKITVSGYSFLCNLPEEKTASGGQERAETRLRITAPDVIISARALPEPVPAEFTGAVGTFQLELSSDKQSIRAGEPLSLKLMLSGTGNLLTLKLPDITLPASFRQNPPEITTTLKTNSLPTSGTISASIVAWPQSGGEYKIPALRMAAFNPETKQFSTLFSKALSITVATSQGTSTSGVEPPITVTEKSGVQSPLLIVTAIALLFLIIRAAAIMAKRKQLNHAKSKVQADTDTSAANLKQKLFGWLEKAGINSPGGLTRVELKNALQNIGLSDEIQSELPAVLDSLDKILYSPTGKKEARTPDSITAKVNTLLQTLRAISASR